jgi:hypothetical protein
MLRGSAESQERVLALIGAAVILSVIVVVTFAVANPFARHDDRMLVVIETPYVGQGVQAGSTVVLHGVEVGRVTSTAMVSNGDVRIETTLQKAPVQGLTNAMAIDFRPVNYFGVSGINIIPKSGGEALHNGTTISVTPNGNFTLTELLSQLGDMSAGALTPKLINVIDRVSRYTDGLTPLFETMVTATRAVEAVQTVSTAQLLANTATIAEAFPPFGNAVIDAALRSHKFDYYPEHTSTPSPSSSGPKLYFPYADEVQTPSLSDEPDAYFWGVYKPFLDLASSGLFAAIGRLEVSHVDDLLPLIGGVKAITDVVPALLRPEKFAANLTELRKRLENLYGGNGQQRALQVRILLDSLPAVEAPLGVMTPLNPVDQATAQTGTEITPTDTPPAPPANDGRPSP